MPGCVSHWEVSHLHCFPLAINQGRLRMVTLLVDGSKAILASRMLLDPLLKSSACSLKHTTAHIACRNGQANVPGEGWPSRGAQLLCGNGRRVNSMSWCFSSGNILPLNPNFHSAWFSFRICPEPVLLIISVLLSSCYFSVYNRIATVPQHPDQKLFFISISTNSLLQSFRTFSNYKHETKLLIQTLQDHK